MLIRIKQWLEPPQFEGDEEQTNQTRIANTLILYLGAALVVVMVVLIPLFAIQKIGSWIISLIIFGGLISGRHLIFKGRLQAGGTLIFGILYLCILALLTLSGGTSSTAMFYFATVVLVAGFFLDARVVNGFTLATFLITVSLTWLQEYGWVTMPKIFVFNSVFSWLATGLGLLFMIRTRDLFVGNLKNALALAHQQNTARQQSEARFRAVVEHRSNGVVFMNAERKIAYVSPAYQQFLGFTPEEMVGHFGVEYIYPADRELTTEKFRELLQTPGGTVQIDYRLQRKNGTYCWVETTAVNLLDNPQVQAVVLNQRDINERKRADEQLKNSEKRFHALIEHGRDNISLLAADGRLLWESPAVNSTLGYAPNQFVGRNIFELIHPDDQAWTSDLYAQVVQTPGRVQEGVFRLLHADGTWRWIECSATNLLEEPGVQAMVLNYRDITPRQQAEEALLKFKLGIERSADAVFITDPQGGILYTNPSFERIYGYTQAEALGHTPRILKSGVVPAAEYKKFWETLLNKNVAAGEIINATKDGRLIIIEASNNPILDPAGEIIGFLGIHRDITERKRAETALRESEARYKNLFESNYAVMLIIDPDTAAIVDANPAACIYYGWRREKLLTKRIDEINTLTPAEVRAEMQLAHAEKRNHFFFKHRRADGSIRDVEVYSGPLTLQGQPLLYSIVHDITERKQAEQALNISEASYRGLFDTVGEAIYILDQGGHFLDVNLGASKMYAYPREVLIGKTPEYVSAPGKNDLARVAQQLQRAFEGEPQQFEFWGLRSNGEIFPKDVRLYKGFYFGQDVVIALARDMTERQRAEEALRESEAKFRAVVQTANDAIISADRHGHVIAWNAAAEKVFGYSTAEALGMPVSQIAPEPFRARQGRGIEQALVRSPNQMAGKMIEAAGLTKAGREFPFEMSLAAWQTQTGQFFTAIIRDISERKQHENELRAIATVSAALRSAPTRAEMLPAITEQLGLLFHCEAISIEIIDPITGEAVLEVAQGAWTSLIGYRQPAGTGLNAILSETKQPYLDNQVGNNSQIGFPRQLMTSLVAVTGAPLLAQEQLIGFVWIGRKKEITQAEVRLLVSVANIAANAIHRATLHERTKKDAADLAQAYDTTLEGWVQALELRDQETEGHTRRVVQLSVKLAQAMGIQDGALENIRRGALLHDIGKMGVPDAILHKPGALDEREWHIMRQHPEYAYKLLEPIAYLRPVLDIPHYHHEKWDGSGYPNGLKGEQIPLAARLFAVVDVWDALRSDRPYRQSWPKEKTLAHIRLLAGTHFDPQVVERFLKLIHEDAPGTPA